MLPQVKVGTMTALPIPAVCVSAVRVEGEGQDSASIPGLALAEAARGENDEALVWEVASNPYLGWVWLDRLAERMLACDGENATVDRMIDRIVYQLYGLSKEEIALVEQVRGAYPRTAPTRHTSSSLL